MKLNHLIASIRGMAISHEKALDHIFVDAICRYIPVAVVTGHTRSYNVGSLCEQPIRTYFCRYETMSFIISYKVLYGKNHLVHCIKVMVFIKFVLVAR